LPDLGSAVETPVVSAGLADLRGYRNQGLEKQLPGPIPLSDDTTSAENTRGNRPALLRRFSIHFSATTIDFSSVELY